jgi:hypothetical protein
MGSGRAFQIFGAAEAKALSPNVFRFSTLFRIMESMWYLFPFFRIIFIVVIVRRGTLTKVKIIVCSKNCSQIEKCIIYYHHYYYYFIYLFFTHNKYNKLKL